MKLINNHRNSGEELKYYISNIPDEWLSLCRQTETEEQQQLQADQGREPKVSEPTAV